jgi:L-ascorbate metabolism protein UlaG (beta-lactamase superfamily)
MILVILYHYIKREESKFMEKLNAKINYLYISGFTVETENHFLVFDYYRDGAADSLSEKLKGKKNIIVFCSHSHPDHFNPEIFKWKNSDTDIEYVLSSDIRHKVKLQGMHYLSPYQELEMGGVNIKAYGSTDQGVSFRVLVDGISLFHAGDLNWWDWYDETQEYNTHMEIMFKKEIEKLRGEHFNLAFFPVDPRLRDSYTLGVEYFMKEIKPDFLIPMHFGDNHRDILEFINSEKNLPVKVLDPLLI